MALPLGGPASGFNPTPTEQPTQSPATSSLGKVRKTLDTTYVIARPGDSQDGLAKRVHQAAVAKLLGRLVRNWPPGRRPSSPDTHRGAGSVLQATVTEHFTGHAR